MAAELMTLEAMERYGPLGPDFLTWLAVGILDNAPPSLDNTPLDITIKGPVVLAGPAGEATKVSLTGDEAVASPEFRSALAEGKKVIRARMALTEGADVYEFTLNGETFDLSGVKVPVPKVPDIDQYLADRVTAFQKLADTIDRLFELFLPLRLSPEQWKKESAGWKRWAKGGPDRAK